MSAETGVYVTKGQLLGLLFAVVLAVCGFILSAHAAEHARLDARISAVEIIAQDSRTVSAAQAATLLSIQGSLNRIERTVDNLTARSERSTP